MSRRWRSDGLSDVEWLIKDTKDPESGEPSFHVRLSFTDRSGVYRENAVRLLRREPETDDDMIYGATNLLIVWAEETVNPGGMYYRKLREISDAS